MQEYGEFWERLEMEYEIEQFKKSIKEQTNEEWFCTLPTEEKAKRIINIAVNSDCDYRTIIEWLKQPHREENEK